MSFLNYLNFVGRTLLKFSDQSFVDMLLSGDSKFEDPQNAIILKSCVKYIKSPTAIGKLEIVFQPFHQCSNVTQVVVNRLFWRTFL